MASDAPKGFFQKLFTRLLPGSAAAMEAESRSWIIRCPACGYERSVWDTGGVQYKAAGTSWRLMRCPQCGQLAWNKVYRRPAGQASQEKAGADGDSSGRV